MKPLSAPCTRAYSRIPLITATILGALGMVFIYSASSYSAGLQGDALYFVKKQLLAYIVGLACMICVCRLHVDKLQRYALPILIISYVLLALVFVPGLGVEYYGAKRWLNLGAFTLQSSELSKFGLVLFLAAFMSKRSVQRLGNFLSALGAGGIMAVLIILEPNMSITICVVMVTMLMLFVGGGRIKHFLVLMIPLVAVAVLLIVSAPYRMQRIVAFLDPWANPKGEGYQLIQSYYALGSGGWFGVGLFNSRQKYLFLPFSESDFILSIIGEETGFLGLILVLMLYVITIAVGIVIAVRAQTRFRSYLAFGITAVLGVQTLLNIAVVSGSIPPTGLPLPMLSSGGSSLIAYMTALGFLSACSRG